jgi:hypothetical protein
MQHNKVPIRRTFGDILLSSDAKYAAPTLGLHFCPSSAEMNSGSAKTLSTVSFSVR